MNTLKLSLVVMFILIMISSIAFSDSKQNPEAVLLNNPVPKEIFAQPDFARAESCTVRHVGNPYWLVENWLTGNEQYLAYQNPMLTCWNPYPFKVRKVSMVLYFEKRTILYASVDIKAADFADPNCVVPGDIISESSEYGFEIPVPGLWRIEIPLDWPIIVNEPYFASFNISTQLSDPNLEMQDSVALVVDSIPSSCFNYNLRDNSIGYVDLGDETNEYYTFPGRLHIYSNGISNGLHYTCGDTNQDIQINSLDIVYLIEYYFGEGREPRYFKTGDLNCDGIIGLVDLILLNSNLFHDGEYDCCF